MWNDPFKAPAYNHLNSGTRGKLKMGLTRGSKQGSVRRAGSSEGYIFLFICLRGRCLKNDLLMALCSLFTRLGSASTYSNTSSFGSLADLGVTDGNADDPGNISVVIRSVHNYHHLILE